MNVLGRELMDFWKERFIFVHNKLVQENPHDEGNEECARKSADEAVFSYISFVENRFGEIKFLK